MDQVNLSLGPLLDGLLLLTNSMLELAKKGEMDELEGLERQRQKLIASYQQLAPDPQEMAPDVVAKLRQLADADTLLMTLCEAIREQLSVQLQGMSASKKMTQAYQNNQR